MNRKKNLYAVLCVLAWMGLGACGEERLPDPGGADNPETPVIPVPVPPGLTSVSISVGGGDLEDKEDDTRGYIPAGAGIVLETGDGIGMETRETATPKTRSKRVSANVSVLVVLLDGQSGVPKAYQLTKVSDSQLKFKVPVEQTFDLLFYSENDSVGTLTASNYLSGATGTEYDTYYDAETLGATFALEDAYAVGESAAGHVPDIMYGHWKSVSSTSITSKSIVFRHIFAKYTWRITVKSKNDGVIAHAGNFGGGMYPRFTQATVDLTKMTALDEEGMTEAEMEASLGETWIPAISEYIGSPTAAEDRKSIFRYEYDSNNPEDVITVSALFIPLTEAYVGEVMTQNGLTTSDPVTVYIDSLTVYTDQFIAQKVANVVTPKAGDPEYSLVPNVHRSLRTTLTKTPPNSWVNEPDIAQGTWAASNIYYDSAKGTLTFDQTEKGTSGQLQGLFFKWGSLIGISPWGEAYNTSTILYLPTNAENGPCATNGYADPVAAGATYSQWTSILAGTAVNNVVPGGDGYGTYAGAGTTQWYGDICAYITGGSWRLPTPDEFDPGGTGLAHNIHWNSTPVALGWYRSTSWGNKLEDSDLGTADIVSTGRGILPTTGGNVGGFGYLKPVENGEMVVTFPAVGRRTDNKGDWENIGSHGYYYSGSQAAGASNPLITDFASNQLRLRTNISPNSGCPVRCIKSR
ncbi:MAG: hypothetical protein LBN29_05055 [Mediterranea sp.]|nr:hypothetical protein [Mediterranea sp.]